MVELCPPVPNGLSTRLTQKQRSTRPLEFGDCQSKRQDFVVDGCECRTVDEPESSEPSLKSEKVPTLAPSYALRLNPAPGDWVPVPEPCNLNCRLVLRGINVLLPLVAETEKVSVQFDVFGV